MKMKAPFTDRFLLITFNLIQEVDRAYDFFAPRSFHQAICPELFKLKRDYARKREEKRFNRLIYYLKQKGYIKVSDMRQTPAVLLTPKGARQALQAKLKLTGKKQRDDKKWIMAAFDIPENKRAFRDMLRDALLDLGYQKLQASVWVCPYDTFEATQEFIRMYRLDPFVRLFLIEEREMS